MKFGYESVLTASYKFGFDVLENWPDEVLDNDKIVMDEHKKKQLTHMIKGASMSRVFELLQKLWPIEVFQYHILRCYKSWLLFVKRVLSPSEQHQYLSVCNECPVFNGALQSLQKEEVQEKAIELVQVVISLVPKDTPTIQLVQKILEAAFQTFPQCR